MATLPGKPILPIAPTVDENHNPTVCVACGKCALGVGVGWVKAQDAKTKDPMYICQGCISITGDLTRMHRLNRYELKALDEGVASVGEWIEANGGITELAHYDELMQRMLVKAAWEGCIRGVRAALREPPF